MNLRIAEGRVWIDGEERRDVVRLVVYFDPRERTRFELEAYADEIDILESGSTKPEPYDMNKLVGTGGSIKFGPGTAVSGGSIGGFIPGTTYTTTLKSDTKDPPTAGDFVS